MRTALAQDRGKASPYSAHIDRLIALQPEVQGVLIATLDGFEIAASLATGSAAKLAAMTSSLLALATAMSSEGGAGKCRDLVIDGDTGRILLMEIAHPVQPLVLAALCSNRSTLGNVLWAVRSCRDEIMKERETV